MFVTVDDGTRIHVEASANIDKPPLLFSNSLGCNLHMWDAQAAAFGDRYRVIRYDSRGHGRSDAPPGPYSIDRLGHDALAVLDALEIESAHFCGLSMGGMVGMWLGANAPDRLRRLVLSNTAAHMPPKENWDKRIATVTTGGMAAIVDMVLAIWFTPGFHERAPEAIAPVREMFLATPPGGYTACCAAIRDMDQRETIKAIKVPTLIIVGDQDGSTPPDRGELIHRSIPGSDFVVIKDAAHLSNIEQRPQFDAALATFLNAG